MAEQTNFYAVERDEPLHIQARIWRGGKFIITFRSTSTQTVGEDQR